MDTLLGQSILEEQVNVREHSTMRRLKIPLVSLTLLLVTHGVLGWQLSAFMGPVWAVPLSFAAHSPTILVWVVVVISDLLLAAALTTPGSERRDEFISLFKTDNRAFLFAVILAFLSVVIITWLYIFVHILVVIAASMLVKIDTQTARWKNRHIFLLLAITSILGLGLGAVVQTVLGLGLEARGF